MLALTIFNDSFNKILKVENEILDDYLFNWSEYSVPKKIIMLPEGKTERYLCFVVEGIQKSYYLQEGKAHVIAFT